MIRCKLGGTTSVVGILLLAACSPAPQTSQNKDGAIPVPEAISTETAPVATEPASTASVPPSDAMRVFIDPVTGEMRDPTDAELQALAKQQALAAKTGAVKQKPKEVILPDGTVAVIMNGSPVDSMQACVQADGSVVVDHECKDQQPAAEEQQ